MSVTLRRTLVSSLVLLLSVVFSAGAAERGRQRTACERVASIALRACQSDVLEELLTTSANCTYIGDRDERAECFSEAREEAGEEAALCVDRHAARRELCELLDEEIYDPDIDPGNFVSPAEAADNPNPYLPLVPGNEWIYENEEEVVTVTVLDETIEIDGVECVVVRDVVTLKEDGELIEDTFDWFAQDLAGNVWYFGEISQNFEDGQLVDLEGSWKQGEDHAKAGILTPIEPVPGQAFRQEYYLREAEDAAEIISISADENTPFVACGGRCVQTLEFTPIEPEAAEYKFALAGIGTILELDLEDGERTELVSFRSGR